MLVASPRAVHALGHGVALDALILSGEDENEVARRPPASKADADTWCCTEGAGGGSYRARGRRTGRWPASPPPGRSVDSYGCGDSFAAGLTFGLAARDGPAAGARARGPLRRRLRHRSRAPTSGSCAREDL